MNQEPETYDFEDFFHGQGPPLTIFEIQRLLYTFMELSLWTVDVRPIQAEARRLEEVFYGREPGYTYGNWHCPHGIGAYISAHCHIGDPARTRDEVIYDRLMRFARTARALGTGRVEGEEAEWLPALTAAYHELLDDMTGGAWAYREYVRQPAPEAPGSR
jgi:hypothetical protein